MKRRPVDDERLDPSGSGGDSPGEDDSGTRLVDLSPYYGHLRCFRGIRPLLIRTNRYTYAPSYIPNERMQNTWLSIALEGIETLFCNGAPREAFGKVAVIGTGNGLDAVGISHIVHPRAIVASDIHPGVLGAARWNIDHYAAKSCDVTVRQSDLFDDYPAGEAFDLIYENLPNIPDGMELFEGVRSASCYEPRADRASPACERYLLTLHHEFLVQARSRLNDSGRVVCVIGGRIPLRVIHRMFRAAGYRSTVAGFGVKIQSEAGVVLPGYAAVESANGASFAYYHPLERCVAISREMSQPAEMRDREGYARALTERLRPCRISATESVLLHDAGEPVCHTVCVIAGRLMREEPSDA